MRNVSQAFVDLGIFNAEGLHVAYVGPFQLTGKSYGQSPWFQKVIKKGYFISDVFLGYRQIPHFIIAMAKEDSNHMILAGLKKGGQLNETEDITEMQDCFNQIHKQVERCATITQAILKFARKSESVPQDFDLSVFIPEVTEMVAKKASVHGALPSAQDNTVREAIDKLRESFCALVSTSRIM